ncbi:MAG TPA: antifreeze protein, partial [Rhodospirillaceae bacterium]|nr:antifreeze protein [Rhodospirillaceae bacterium]
GLRVAAEELRLGETILFALVSLGHDGLDRVNPITMNEVISRLRLVGLDTESRALALEAAIAAGL